MSKPNPVAHQLDYISYEQQLENLPPLPARPFILEGECPTGELATMGQAAWQLEREERVRDSRLELSGYNAHPWASTGPQTPAELEQERKDAAEYREQRSGAPAQPEDAPRYRDAGGRPFSGLRG